MATSTEIKQRAQRLARENMIPEAIRTLEVLVEGETVNPYDFVLLADLYAQGGHKAEACSYYEKAAEAYSEASLNRSAIALCRKVLRTYPGERPFLLLLAQLCERDGLVWDAVAWYLDYADHAESAGDDHDAPWLASLASLTPKNTQLLLRQSETLARMGRAVEAVGLLRRGAAAVGDESEAQILRNEADLLGRTSDTRDGVASARPVGAAVASGGAPDATLPDPTVPPGFAPAPDLTLDAMGILDPSHVELDATAEVTPSGPSGGGPGVEAGGVVHDLTLDAGLIFPDAADGGTGSDADAGPEAAETLQAVTDDTNAVGPPESWMGSFPKEQYEAGLDLAEAGRWREAVEAFAAAATDPELAGRAHEQWGRCLRELGEHTEAIRVLQSALGPAGKAPGLRYQLALAFEAAGRQEEAMRMHRAVLRSDPDFEGSQERIRELEPLLKCSGSSKSSRRPRWRSSWSS